MNLKQYAINAISRSDFQTKSIASYLYDASDSTATFLQEFAEAADSGVVTSITAHYGTATTKVTWEGVEYDVPLIDMIQAINQSEPLDYITVSEVQIPIDEIISQMTDNVNLWNVLAESIYLTADYGSTMSQDELANMFYQNYTLKYGIDPDGLSDIASQVISSLRGTANNLDAFKNTVLSILGLKVVDEQVTAGDSELISGANFWTAICAPSMTWQQKVSALASNIWNVFQSVLGAIIGVGVTKIKKWWNVITTVTDAFESHNDDVIDVSNYYNCFGDYNRTILININDSLINVDLREHLSENHFVHIPAPFSDLYIYLHPSRENVAVMKMFVRPLAKENFVRWNGDPVVTGNMSNTLKNDKLVVQYYGVQAIDDEAFNINSCMLEAPYDYNQYDGQGQVYQSDYFKPNTFLGICNGLKNMITHESEYTIQYDSQMCLAVQWARSMDLLYFEMMYYLEQNWSTLSHYDSDTDDLSDIEIDLANQYGSIRRYFAGALLGTFYLDNSLGYVFSGASYTGTNITNLDLAKLLIGEANLSVVDGTNWSSNIFLAPARYALYLPLNMSFSDTVLNSFYPYVHETILPEGLYTVMKDSTLAAGGAVLGAAITVLAVTTAAKVAAWRLKVKVRKRNIQSGNMQRVYTAQYNAAVNEINKVVASPDYSLDDKATLINQFISAQTNEINRLYRYERNTGWISNIRNGLSKSLSSVITHGLTYAIGRIQSAVKNVAGKATSMLKKDTSTNTYHYDEISLDSIMNKLNDITHLINENVVNVDVK